jgi:hypothetical protein
MFEAINNLQPGLFGLGHRSHATENSVYAQKQQENGKDCLWETAAVEEALAPSPNSRTRLDSESNAPRAALPELPIMRPLDMGMRRQSSMNLQVAYSIELSGEPRPMAAAKVLPLDYARCDMADLVAMISGMIQEAMLCNDDENLDSLRAGCTRFHSL